MIVLFVLWQVKEDQMVLSHTPLKMFNSLHDKHVLVSGQQNIKEILQRYPFGFFVFGEKLSLIVFLKSSFALILSWSSYCIKYLHQLQAWSVNIVVSYANS